MNRPVVISVIGNSVPLLIQPFRTSTHEITYSEHLRNKGFQIVPAMKESVTIADLYRYLEDEVIRYFPEYVILNFGIVECTFRARPRWLQNIFAMNAWNNSIINKGYNSPITRGSKYLVKTIFRKTYERFAFRLGVKHRWLKPRDYSFIMRDICKRLFQDTPTKKIIILGMLPVADWVEREAPGTRASVEEYNTIMKRVTSDFSNVTYIDPLALSDELISEDGIHFNAKGHEILANYIFPLLNQERLPYTNWSNVSQYHNLYPRLERWYKNYQKE